MAKSRYERGADLERQLCDFMEYHNFPTIRSAGSKGMFDVISISPAVHQGGDQESPTSFQCKIEKTSGRKELEKVVAIHGLIHTKIVWVQKTKPLKPPVFILVPSMNRYEPHEFVKKVYGIHDVTPWFEAIKKHQDFLRLMRKK